MIETLMIFGMVIAYLIGERHGRRNFQELIGIPKKAQIRRMWFGGKEIDLTNKDTQS